jgi:cation diffusion facilitator family transporter
MTGYARVAIYSCLVNLGLMGTKYLLGEISGSLALKADAIHSFADVISSGAIFLGIVISARKTKIFPEGLYKVENLVALLSSFFILFAAYEIGAEALESSSDNVISNIPLVTIGIIFMMAIAGLFSRYELKVGLEVGSPSLVADARHVTTDLLASLVILFGIISTHLGYHLDRYVALLVAVIVAKMGVQIFLEAVKVLLDATLDYTTLDGIRKILESHDEVMEIISIGGRNSGRFKFVEISLTTNLKRLSEAHVVTSEIEEEILDRYPNIDKILIHYEPEHKNVEIVATPLDVKDGKSPNEKSSISQHFGDAPYFAIIDRDFSLKKISIRSYMENPFKDVDKKKGVRVAEFLFEHAVDEVRSRVDFEGKGSGYALEAMNIAIVTTAANTLGEMIEQMGRNLNS